MRVLLSSAMFFSVSICFGDPNTRLDAFDFTPKTIALVLSRAKGGDLYYQALYGGLTMWGYVNDVQDKQEASAAPQNVKTKSTGVKDDWFDVAEKGITTTPTADNPAKGDWIENSAAAQNPIGLYFKAYRLETKKGLRDIAALHDLWNAATGGLIELGKNNDPVALTLLGIIAEKRYVENASLDLAKLYYRKGTDCNSALAANNLCELLFKDAQSKEDYRELLKLNSVATKGAVKSADTLTKTILDSAENKFSARAVPFVPFWLLPGKYHFINPVSRLLVRIGGIVTAIAGALFGWFIFPYTLAPIKFLIRAPMEIFIDRVLGAIGFFFFLWVVSQAWFCNLFY